MDGMMERFDSKLDAATRSHQRLTADAAIRAVDIDEHAQVTIDEASTLTTFKAPAKTAPSPNCGLTF